MLVVGDECSPSQRTRCPVSRTREDGGGLQQRPHVFLRDTWTPTWQQRQPHAQSVGAARVPGGGKRPANGSTGSRGSPFVITKGPSGVSPAVLGLSCVTSYGREGTASAGQDPPSRDEAAEEPGEDRPRGMTPRHRQDGRSRQTVSAGFMSLHSTY